MSAHGDPAALARALRQHVDAAEQEVAAMPFFVRPMVRGGFAKRTGKSYDEWRAALDALAARPVPSPALAADLERLAESFRTAPERAQKAMGNDPVALAAVKERAAAREQAARALLAWARGG